jgi:hypothetical protein
MINKLITAFIFGMALATSIRRSLRLERSEHFTRLDITDFHEKKSKLGTLKIIKKNQLFSSFFYINVRPPSKIMKKSKK